MTGKRFECPHCRKQGLELLNYGNDKVWECMECGAELWYCETIEEMKQRCKELKRMTDRYRALGSALYDKQTTNWKKCIGNFKREDECKDICNRLNSLIEENEELKRENQYFKKTLRVAYSISTTESTKNVLKIIAKHCGIDLE